jgi:hypothetical protein
MLLPFRRRVKALRPFLGRKMKLMRVLCGLTRPQLCRTKLTSRVCEHSSRDETMLITAQELELDRALLKLIEA